MIDDKKHLARRKTHIEKSYGITYEQYSKLLVQQNFRCKICQRRESDIHPISGRTKYLCVDHDHDTGKVRALLCESCNKLLGFAKENPEILMRAFDYLQELKPLIINSETTMVIEIHNSPNSKDM